MSALTDGWAYFETFNARHLEPEDVAQSFVPSSHFTDLVGNYHAVLVGPRGSGKTTLLKMLQQRALEVWNHADAQSYRRRIRYTGVFVPADVNWGAQVKALGYGKLDPEIFRRLSIAAFTTHVLKALTEAMISRLRRISRSSPMPPYRRARLSDEDESSLAERLAVSWRLNPTIPSLLSIKQALRARLSEIRLLGNRLGSYKDSARQEQLLFEAEYLDLHFLESALVAIECFNDLTNETNAKWAFCFDELEIAPPWIQEELLRSLRSVDQKIVFKLAVSPFSPTAQLILQTIVSPAPGNDLRQIPLWYTDRGHAIKFCTDLWLSMTTKAFSEMVPANRMLGASHFDPIGERPRKGHDVYGPSGEWRKRFEALALRDRSFSNYLRKMGINIESLPEIGDRRRDAILRKIAPIVAVREYFRGSDDVSGTVARGRKSSELYAGAESLFAITEGNPRWFIGMVGRLLAHANSPSASVPPHIQADEIDDAGDRFVAMLRTAVIPPSVAGMFQASVTDLLDRIGNHFANELLVGPFHPEPRTSFIVDENTPPEVEEVLQICLNLGAIVYVSTDQATLVLHTLKKRRFRLSYLLAPKYKLPLRLGKPTSLLKILASTGHTKPPGNLL